MISFFFFFNDTATTEIYTLSLHDALPISEFGVDIAHSELLRDLGQIGRPFDAAGGLELRPGLVGQFEECAQRGMIDDEAHLRPVPGGLPDIPGGRVFPHAPAPLLLASRPDAL